MDPLTVAIIGGAIATLLGGYVLVEVIKGVPKAVRKVGRKVLGSNLLILGPTFSGKSSLIRYMKHAKYQDPDMPEDPDVYPIDKDDRTTDVVVSSKEFEIELDPDYKFTVATTTDIPGILTIEDQIGIALDKDKIYEVIIVVVAVNHTRRDSWINDFCSVLDSKLIISSNLKRNLKSLTFLINKIDDMDEVEIEKTLKHIKAIVDSKLKTSIGLNLSRVQVLKLTLFKKHNAKTIAGNALKKIYDSIKINNPLSISRY